VVDAVRALRLSPVAGALRGDVARYLLAGGLVLVLGTAMGFRPPGGAAGVLAGLAVFAPLTVRLYGRSR